MTGLMQIGFSLLDKIAATQTGAVILTYIKHLSVGEIKISVAVAAVLILFLVWRWFGLIMVLVMLLLYLLSYVLFINNISDLYKNYQTENIQHMQKIEKELEKNK